MKPAQQHTLKTAIQCSGIGLHSGLKVSMTLRPGPVDSGIVFRRVDTGGEPVAIHHHPVVEPADDLAAGALEEEREHGMGETGQAAQEHARGETECMAGVLEVVLADPVQMSAEVFHGDNPIPEAVERGSIFSYIAA